MKKLLVVLCSLLILCACSSKQEVIGVQEKPTNEELVGGWTLNEELNPIEGDVYFEKAKSKYTGMDLTPLFVLGSQPTDPSNIAYLCYGKAVVPNAVLGLKVAIVGVGENSEDTTFLNVVDFNVNDYLEGDGSTTPEGLMGGWQDNGDLENTLHIKTNETFNKALNGLTGVAYSPVAVLATQVVAGENYAILATGKSVSAEPISHLYIMNIYEDLDGNSKLNNICGIDLSTFNK